MMKTDAQRDRVLHVVIERIGFRRTLNHHESCPEHICVTCGEKGHNRTNCPTSQCESLACGLFGHLPNDCPFQYWFSHPYAASLSYRLFLEPGREWPTSRR